MTGLLLAIWTVWLIPEAVIFLNTVASTRRIPRDWTFPLVVASVAAAAAVASTVSPQHDARRVQVEIGVCVAILGLALRIWAVLTLGRFFKVVVVIQDGHRVVDRGPYRVLRHPSYTGLLLILLGIGLMLGWAALLALVLIPLPSLLIRIHVEEAALAGALGEPYRDYAARTRRLIPFLW